MKAAWILALAAAPLATLTVWGWLDPSDARTPAAAIAESVDAAPAAAVVAKKPAWVHSLKPVAAALADADPLSPAALPGLDGLRPDTPLGALRNAWPLWTAARNLADEILGLPGDGNQDDRERLEAVKRQWDEFREKLEAAKLPAGSALAALIEQRIDGLVRQIARLEGQAEATAAAEAVRLAFAAQRHEECLARSREWLTKYARTAPDSLADEIKALGYRAEFQAERQRSQARLKAAATPAEREALLAAFLDRFSSPAALADSERAVLEQCRRYLEALRAEAAAQAQWRAASEAIRIGMADLPDRFDERLARALRILREHPGAPVKAALRGRVQGWLEEFLPEKTVEEPPELQEAETKEGRILRGYFREVPGPGGTVGYKRYDTLAERQNPTADVGTWPGRDLAASPGPALPQRVAGQYRDARNKLLQQPGRRELWESFAASCERLQAECDEYRVKPGSGREAPGFRREAAFARQVLSGPAMDGLKAIFGESVGPQAE